MRLWLWCVHCEYNQCTQCAIRLGRLSTTHSIRVVSRSYPLEDLELMEELRQKAAEAGERLAGAGIWVVCCVGCVKAHAQPGRCMACQHAASVFAVVSTAPCPIACCPCLLSARTFGMHFHAGEPAPPEDVAQPNWLAPEDSHVRPALAASVRVVAVLLLWASWHAHVRPAPDFVLIVPFFRRFAAAC